MTQPGLRSWFVPLLLIAVLHATPSVGGDAHVQFCWAMGKFDHTIYFAETENRENRQADFDELLEISGIDHHPVQCRFSEALSHQETRVSLFREWREAELEIVNTTFMSDLDY